jgi:hypothetical protein
MQTIRTRYHGPSNVKGSRFSAQCEAGRIYVPYNHALNLDENHMEAARQLIAKLGWPGDFAGGCFDGDYYWSPVVYGSAWSTVITSTVEAA